MYATFLLLLCVCLGGQGGARGGGGVGGGRKGARTLLPGVLVVTTFKISFLGVGVGWSKLTIIAKLSVISD